MAAGAENSASPLQHIHFKYLTLIIFSATISILSQIARIFHEPPRHKDTKFYLPVNLSEKKNSAVAAHVAGYLDSILLI